MFEHRHEPILSRSAFRLRLLRHALVAIGLVAASLGIGILGYHGFEGLGWIDAIVNAAMILGGMGPVDALRTSGGKLFAAAYALFAGIVFLVVVGVLFAPAIHRFLHRFHLENESDSLEEDPPA